MIQTVSSVFERELLKLIAKRREKLAEDLIVGVAVTTIEEYRGLVSRISELDQVVSMFDDVAESMKKL